MRLAFAFAATLAMLAGCNSTNNGSTASCAAAGGTCVLGGGACARSGPQDCNPDRNPGGAFCCLELPDAAAPSDSGDAASTDASGACTLPDSSQSCAQAGLTCCGGACINESNDPLHCGGCNVPCAAPTSMCLNGACHAPTCAPACSATEQCCLVNHAGPQGPPSCVAGTTCPIGCPSCT